MGAITLAALLLAPAVLVAVTAGEGAVASAAGAYPTFYVNSTGVSGAEPNIGVTSTGTIFQQAGLNTMRSKDGGATWQRVNPQSTGTATLDPILEVDAGNDRVFVDQLYVACSVLAYTDVPDTATSSPVDWVTNPFACGQKIGQDHQKLAAGPLPADPEIPNAPTYDRALYYAWSDVGTADFMVARSPDGGLTWIQGQSIAVGLDDRGVVGAQPSGIIHVDPTNGYVYGEYGTNFDSHGASVSKDGGFSWDAKEITPRGLGHGAFTNGGLYTDSAGNVYVAWFNDADFQIHYAYSENFGTTWSAPMKVSGVNYAAPASGFDVDGTIRSTIYPTLVAGAEGRVAIAYYGTEDRAVFPKQCDAAGSGTNCRWRLHVTTLEDANTANPDVRTYAVTDGATTAAKYAQIGSIHVGGGDVDDRNLLDFIDSAMDKNGWPVIAFTDGCTGAANCADDAGGALSVFAKMGDTFNLLGTAEPPGSPEVKITSPAAGATVPAGTTAVSGTVNRDGGAPNVAPTATLGATPTSGDRPLPVAFALGASDADGAVTGWSLDIDTDGTPEYGATGAPPATQSHTFETAGTFVVTLTVVDDESATDTATVTVTVTNPSTGGVPVPSGKFTASIYAYNTFLGLSNTVAEVTGAALSDETPRYVAGEMLVLSSRDTASTDSGIVIGESTVVKFRVYSAAGTDISGPIATTGYTEDPLTSGCTGTCYGYDSGLWQLPGTTAGGEYYLVPIATVGGTDYVIGVKKIIVLGAPTAGSEPSDAGHTIGDSDADGTLPTTEIQWGDLAVAPATLAVTIKLAAVQPGGVGTTPFVYGIHVNGLELQVYILGGSSVWDPANAQQVAGNTVTYDAVAGTVRVTIPRAYLASYGADCPCNVYLDARVGDVVTGTFATQDRAPNAGSVNVGFAPFPGTVARSTTVIPLGSSSDPEAADPSGETPLPDRDIRRIWVQNEAPTTFEVVMQVENMAGQPPSVDVGAAKLASSYTIEFCTNNNFNADVTGPLFCYRAQAVNALPSPTFSGGVVQRDGTGSCTFSANPIVAGGAFNTAASTVTWRFNRAAFNVVQNSGAVTDCNTVPPVRTGVGLVDGTTLSLLEGSTGASAGAVLIASTSTGGDMTDPQTSRPYVFGAVAPLLVEAGGPYSGSVGQAVAIGGVASGGTGPYTCAWTGSGTFASASSCATTVTFASAGAKTLTLTVTDATNAVASDTATVNVAALGERVDLYLDAETEPRASVAVDTSGAPTASWSLNVDLSGLEGAHSLTAKWVDAADAVLDSHAVSVQVQSATGAFVTVASPADDPAGLAPHAGTIAVAGQAGHSGAALPAATGSPALRTSTVHVDVRAPCAACASPVGQGMGASLAWGAGPGSALDGTDGAWIPVAAYAGRELTLSGVEGATFDVVFYSLPRSAEVGRLAGADAVKAGTIPRGAAWAFVYARDAADTAALRILVSTMLPQRPGDLAATGVAGGVALAWLPAYDGGAPVTAYEVTRDGSALATVAGTLTGYTNLGLDAGTSRTYAVRAVNAHGAGALSAPATAAALARTDTVAPGAVPGVAAAALSPESVRVTWSPATDDVGVDRYLVFRGGVLAGVASGLELVDAGLEPASALDYVVRAVDASSNVGPAGDAASVLLESPPAETVTITIDGAPFATLTVDTTTQDPVAWSTPLDTTTLADGLHTLVAAYDDGAGGVASRTVRFATQNAAEIAITSPADGAEVGASFTVTGATTGTGGPNAPAALQAQVPPGLAAIDAALADEPGYLGVAPALDGTPVLTAYFTGAAPTDLPPAPAGWALAVEPNVVLERAVRKIPIDEVNAPPRTGPPLPAMSDGIGPGSHLLMTMLDEPGFLFACTANFVWRDASGNVYLGAAGHCFMPETKTSTHGSDRDYDPARTSVRVCVSDCTNGGQTGFEIQGTTVALGPVVYARQTLGGADLGNDFGLVKIPESQYGLVRTHMPVWNGPHGTATTNPVGTPVVLYGNAAAFGEAFPTMARAGVGMGMNANRWLANIPSAFGDSGSAANTGVVNQADPEIVEGDKALGALTHITGSTGIIGGNTMARSIQMAAEAGLSITMLKQGESVISAPGIPSGVVAFAGDGAVTVQWTAPGNGGSPITTYTVKYGTADGGPYGSTLDVTGTTATVTGLTNGVTYFFVVTATNAVGESGASAQASATPQAASTVPGAPTGLVATASAGSVQLGWSAPASDGGSPITGYLVHVGTASGTYSTTSSASGTSATVTGLTNGETYWFAVSAVNAVGEGPLSNEASATPQDTSLPAAPTGVFAVAGDGKATLYWNEAASGSPITGYTVKYGTSSGSYTASMAVTDTTAVVTPLTNGVTYRFVVTATNANGEGPASAEVSATPTAGTTSTFTVEVRVTENGVAVVDWTTADAYDGSTFTHPVTGLAPGSYAVEARLLADGTPIDVATVGVSVANALPTADAGLDREVDEGTLVALAGAGSDAESATLEFRWTQTGGPLVSLTSPDQPTATFTAPNLAEDATYTFRLAVTDGDGGSATDDVTITAKDLDELAIATVNGAPLPVTSPLSGTATVAGTAHVAGAGGVANTPPTAVISDVVVTFMDVAASAAGSTDIDGTIVAHQWDLGNWDTATGAALAYTYAAEGSYTLTLTVTDDRGASGQATFGPFAVTPPPPPGGFVVDAGDSSYVKIGDPVALSAQAFEADGAVLYAWDTDGDGVADASGQAIQVATAGRAPGLATFTVTATDADGEVDTDSVNVLLYNLAVVRQTFANDVLVGLNDEDAGATGTVDGATFSHAVPVPSGTTLMDATLTWNTYAGVVPANPSGLAGGPNDFDLYLFRPDGVEHDRSADFDRPESKAVTEPVPGAWSLQVRSYVVVNDRYTLTVDLTTGPADPVPVANQASNVCQSATTQILEASVTGALAVGAWDLDLDGEFDDALGLTASTSFPLDGVARLVRFRATTDEGYRDTILVALRPSVSCAAAPSVVVIAIADTGVNPYSREWAGEHVPYPDLAAFTTMDPANPGPKDVEKRHAQTNALLPFTKHPSTYIPGFPAGAEPISLRLGNGYYKSSDDAAVWSRGHSAIALNTWYWIPGTKIIAAMDTTDTAAVNSAADSTPLFDDDGHGQASASVAAGNYFGSCPRCVLAFFEGLGGDVKAFDEPWIDFVSVSGGSLGNVGTPDGGLLGFEEATKAAAERGQTLSYAAGNGNENAFVTPENTYTSNSLGPDWTIDVGAVVKGTNGAILGTGKPVDWSSYGAGSIPSGCRNSYSGQCGHSGTSAATPISTGHLANALLAARIALGDAAAGQKTPAQADGQRQAIAVGAAVPASTWLADGVLTRAELWNVAFHCASSFGGVTVGYPVTAPASPVDYAYGGYGIADAPAGACAASALVAGGAVPAKPDADEFYETDEAIRDALWGDWDGDGDGAEGGNFNTGQATPAPTLAGLTLADVDSLDEVTRVLADTHEALGFAMSVPVTETYYLHRSACAGGSDPQWMDRTPAAAREAGHGCAGVATNMDQDWTATVATTADFPAGSAVAAKVRAFGLAPHPGVTMKGQLLLNGAAIGTGQATVTVVSLALVTTPCHEWAMSFVTTQAVPAGATLTFRAFTDAGTGDVPMCYEGGLASSRVSITQGGGGGPVGPTATIVTPAQGDDFDPAEGPVTVSGTATFPPVATSSKLYLRRANCANLNTDTLYLSPVNGADPGNGCALGAGAAAPAQNFVEKYVLIESELPVTLAPGGTVAGTLYFGTQGADPAEVELRLQSSAGLVGSKLVSVVAASVAGTPGATAVPFSFPVSSSTAGVPLSSMTFEIAIKRQGAIHWTELENPASFIEIPELALAANSIEVAVNDPTFATGALAVTGTTSWTASWDTSGLADGAYTIYARARSGSTVGAATAVGVTITGQSVGRVPGLQVQAVPAGGVPAADGWTSVPLAGDEWSYAWDTAALLDGAYDLHVRLLADGVEVKRESFTATTYNPDAPVLAPIGNLTVLENATLDLALVASDADLDPLAFTATGLPAGATLAADGRLRWATTFEDAGAYAGVTVVVSDPGGLTDEETFTITVTNVNRPPVLAAVGDRTLGEGDALTIELAATDADGDAITYSAVDLPAGATLVGSTFTWTPTYRQAGSYVVGFTATDGTDSSTVSATLTVLDVNHAPVLAAIGPQAVAEASTLAFTLAATDVNGDDLTFAATGLPEGATLDGGAFTWTPTYDDAGTYTIVFSVSDGALADSETVIVTVANVNRAPELAAVGAKSTRELMTLTFTVGATDPDGDTLDLAATPLPDGAAFSAGTFTWRPRAGQAGTYVVEFSATDGTLADVEVVTIEIAPQNRAPVVTLTAPAIAGVSTPASFVASATDPDGDAFAFAWAFGDGNTSTEQAPVHQYGAAGTFEVTVTATDEFGAAGTATATVIVESDPPVTTATVTGTSTADGWYDESARVALAATDAGAGVAGTTYALNANPTFSAYSAPIALPAGEATHTVRFRSTDAVGNLEAVKTTTVKVDTLAPTVRLNLRHPVDVVMGPANITATASDAGSGVAMVEFLVDGAIVCTDADGSDGWSCLYDPPLESAGRRVIQARATDRLAHSAIDATGAIVVPGLPAPPAPAAFGETVCVDAMTGAATLAGESGLMAVLGRSDVAVARDEMQCLSGLV